MNSPEKKAEETKVLFAFRKGYKDFPKGKLVMSESPDFILKISPKRTIGIELVQLIFEKESNSLSEKIHVLLEKKEEKLRLYYKQRLNAYWLIIYSQSLADKLSYNYSNKTSELQIGSSFDKVFLFETKKGKIINLSL